MRQFNHVEAVVLSFGKILKEEMDEQSDKETAAGQALIDVIKALHNSAPEEAPTEEESPETTPGEGDDQSEDKGSED